MKKSKSKLKNQREIQNRNWNLGVVAVLIGGIIFLSWSPNSKIENEIEENEIKFEIEPTLQIKELNLETESETEIAVAPVATIVKAERKEPKIEPSDPLDAYTDEDIMCITNMVYGEISAITYDNRYTEDEQNFALQQWARVVINHVNNGIANSYSELMRMETGSGYYIWHPSYATERYMNKCIAENPNLYERCRVNVMVAASEQMVEEVPDNVFYADLKPQGSGVYRCYDINTGYYHSVVYLSYK